MSGHELLHLKFDAVKKYLATYSPLAIAEKMGEVFEEYGREAMYHPNIRYILRKHVCTPATLKRMIMYGKLEAVCALYPYLMEHALLENVKNDDVEKEFLNELLALEKSLWMPSTDGNEVFHIHPTDVYMLYHMIICHTYDTHLSRIWGNMQYLLRFGTPEQKCSIIDVWRTTEDRWFGQLHTDEFQSILDALIQCCAIQGSNAVLLLVDFARFIAPSTKFCTEEFFQKIFPEAYATIAHIPLGETFFGSYNDACEPLIKVLVQKYGNHITKKDLLYFAIAEGADTTVMQIFSEGDRELRKIIFSEYRGKFPMPEDVILVTPMPVRENVVPEERRAIKNRGFNKLLLADEQRTKNSSSLSDSKEEKQKEYEVFANRVNMYTNHSSPMYELW